MALLQQSTDAVCLGLWGWDCAGTPPREDRLQHLHECTQKPKHPTAWCSTNCSTLCWTNKSITPQTNQQHYGSNYPQTNKYTGKTVRLLILWDTRAVPPSAEPLSAEEANSSPDFPEDCNYPAGSSQANSNWLHVFLTGCSMRETEPHCRSEDQTHSALSASPIGKARAAPPCPALSFFGKSLHSFSTI